MDLRTLLERLKDTPRAQPPGRFIAVAHGDGLPATFIDGGNGELLHGNTCTLQLIRVCGLFYEKKLQEKWVKTAHCVLQQEDTLVKYALVPALIAEGVLGTDLSTAGNAVRRACELALAKELLKPGTALVLDGSLDDPSLSELKRCCTEKNILLIGLSKTCSLTYQGGYLPVLLLPLATVSIGYFVWKNTYFVKLHPKTKHIFRADIQGDPEVAVRTLARYASDPSFFGYPYPLISADKCARVTLKQLSAERASLAAQNSKVWATVQKDMTAMDAHSILDDLNQDKGKSTK